MSTSNPFLSPANASPAELLFSDLPNELAITRRVLERVPDGHTDWVPHTKSASLGRLATHLAELPRLTTTVLTTDELDWATSGFTPRTLPSTAEILALFDEQSAAMQAALASADWNAMAKEWVMRAGDHVFVRARKADLIRGLGISHMAHHRAQIGVYLRLLSVPVPKVYGPTADES